MQTASGCMDDRNSTWLTLLLRPLHSLHIGSNGYVLLQSLVFLTTAVQGSEPVGASELRCKCIVLFPTTASVAGDAGKIPLRRDRWPFGRPVDSFGLRQRAIIRRSFETYVPGLQIRSLGMPRVIAPGFAADRCPDWPTLKSHCRAADGFARSGTIAS
jgi:hypothetical protein